MCCLNADFIIPRLTSMVNTSRKVGLTLNEANLRIRSQGKLQMCFFILCMEIAPKRVFSIPFLAMEVMQFLITEALGDTDSCAVPHCSISSAGAVPMCIRSPLGAWPLSGSGCFVSSQWHRFCLSFLIRPHLTGETPVHRDGVRM